ncbi:transposase [Mesorhizobium sp. 113-3-3]|nr:transposase [Mesorhizobium sp. 113-3-3]
MTRSNRSVCIERFNGEIKRRNHVVDIFPNDGSGILRSLKTQNG